MCDIQHYNGLNKDDMGGGGVSLWKFDIIKAVKLVEDHWGLFLYTSLWFNQNN